MSTKLLALIVDAEPVDTQNIMRAIAEGELRILVAELSPPPSAPIVIPRKVRVRPEFFEVMLFTDAQLTHSPRSRKRVLEDWIMDVSAIGPKSFCVYSQVAVNLWASRHYFDILENWK